MKYHMLQDLDVKSFNLEDILKVVNTALIDKNDNDYTVHIEAKKGSYKVKISEPKAKASEGKILIPLQDGFEVIKKADILYCEADDNYTKLYLRTNETYIVSKTLKYFEQVLGTDGFVRVHKSFLVNANDVVKYYRKGKTGRIKLSNGQFIPVSASKKAALMAYFKSYS